MKRMSDKSKFLLWCAIILTIVVLVWLGDVVFRSRAYKTNEIAVFDSTQDRSRGAWEAYVEERTDKVPVGKKYGPIETIRDAKRAAAKAFLRYDIRAFFHIPYRVMYDETEDVYCVATTVFLNWYAFDYEVILRGSDGEVLYIFNSQW